MDWTDERTTIIKKLWQEGLSGGKIAKQLSSQFGVSLTRSAIMGKVHRLGLKRDRPARPRRVAITSVRPESGNIPARAAKRKPKVAKALPPPAPMPAAAAFPKREPRATTNGTATILTLEEFMCKWPIGDPAKDGFSFCGHRTHAMGPYCIEHTRVAYQPQHRKARAARHDDRYYQHVVRQNF